jgi:gliding motility-associated-like protein
MLRPLPIQVKVLPNPFSTAVSLILLSVLLVFLTTTRSYSQGTQVERRKGTTTAQYGFLEYLPPDYNVDTNKKFPTIIFLHGVGEKGNGTTDLYKVAANGPPRLIKDGKWPVKSPKTGLYPAENFIVISVQSSDGYPLPDNMHTFVKWVKANYRADPDRTYMCGLSAGGISTWRYLDKHSDEVAAIIPVCGNGNISGSDECAYKHVPIWAFHGDKDPSVNWGGSTNPVRIVNLCVPKPNPLAKVTIYPGATHDVWTRTYSLSGMSETTDPKYNPFDMSIYDWLLQYKRGTVPSINPTANAGIDITLTLPVVSTNITGTATPGSGTIASLSWTKISGPAVTMTNQTTATVSLAGMVTGIYTFRFTVTNSNGASASDDVTVIVVSANLAPVANAGTDKTITLPTNSLNLNGSGTDIDGTIASYAWSKVSGPAASMTGQTTANLSLTGLVAGTYVFSLTVTDNKGATATDNVTVIVNPAAVNQLPTANAGTDATVNLPTSSTNLPGSGSDPDGSITAYLWEKVSGPSVTMTNATTSTLSVSALVAGVYVFRLTVTDNAGGKASDQVTLTVIASNQSPTANAGSDLTITLPTNSTTITGSGNDIDGTVNAYAWTQVNGPNTATLSNSTTAALTASGMVAGTYTFRLTVTDDKGSTGFDDMKVVVNAAPVNVPPTSNAGPDQTITLPTNSIALNGSGSDTDGTISFAWIKVSGPAATLTNQNTATLTASALIAGTYVFRLTVTDDDNATAIDNVTVTVQPAVVNQTPVVNAGADVSITLPTNSTTLVGTAMDADGTIASYAWTKVSGPAATLSGNTTATLSLTALVAGTYVFQLTATDDKGATGSDNVTVVVNAANVSPTANAGSDITINLPTNATVISGSGNDSDGTVSSYLWSQVSGPSTATLSSQATASLNVSALIAGTYTFRLTVTDNDGATGTDDVKVIVNAANQTPTANAGVNKIITLPTNTVNFTGSGADTDGTISSYAWTQINGPATATLSNQNTVTVTATVTLDGVYTFRLTVIDNAGATDFDDVQLTVNPATVNQLPIANAGANQTITLPINSLNLTGSGSDTDGTITSYQWTKFSGPTATLTNANAATLSLSALNEGSYVFRLTVTDNLGATDTDDVTVTVLPAAVNQPPVANAGTDQTITLPLNTITLFGSGSDPDGTVLTYAWTKVSGPTGTLANQTTNNLTLSDLLQGTYVLRLTVTDEDGATDFDDVNVIVNAVATNQTPTANAGADRTITLPTNSLNVSGSGSDPDGSIVAYSWVKVSGPTVTLGATNQATLSLSALIEGIYVFRLEVEDDDGATDTDDVRVTVQPGTTNQPPLISAGIDKSIFLPTNSVIVSGTASDPDGVVSTLLWTKVSGPVSATLLNENTTILTLSDLVEGVYTFRLTGTDDDGATAFDEIKVTVNPVATNQPPTANAGVDKSIKLPTNSTTLTGNGTDPDGTIASYVWIKISGPAVTINGANTETLALTDLVEGNYIFELTVTDDDGESDVDQVSVEVLPASLNVPPTVSAGDDVSLKLPENAATLFATATDNDGTIASRLWTQVSGPAATLANTTTTDLSLTNLVEGVYTFRFEATDNGGLSAFDDVKVTVLQEVTFPEPTVTAGDDQVVQLPANSVDITALAESESVIDSYLWEQIEGDPITFDGDTSTLQLTGLAAGIYAFRVTVRDAQGQQASDEVYVLVKEPFVHPFNVFSPNNDSPNSIASNDTWTIENADKLTDCDVSVYNRSGQKVYHSTGYDSPWDGTMNGKQVPEGVYFYVIRCAGQESMNGTVTIIR